MGIGNECLTSQGWHQLNRSSAQAFVRINHCYSSHLITTYVGNSQFRN